MATPKLTELGELSAFKKAVMHIGNCVIITTDAAGSITAFNLCAENTFGYSADEVLGKNLVDILQPVNAADGKGRKRSFKSFLKEILASEESEWNVNSSFGLPIIMMFSGGTIELSTGKDGYIFSGFDISEERRIEAAFEGIQLFNEKILSTTPTILYLYDLIAEQLVFSNRDFYSALGYSEAESTVLKERSLRELVHPDDKEKRRQHWLAIDKSKDGELLDGEFRMRYADGSWRWYQYWDTVFTRTETGGAALVLGAILDISDRKFYEEALNEANKKLSETNSLLTDANNLKTELLGIAAHDLKNPLSIIKNLASILKENEQEEVAELSDVIKQASEQMLDLISELLESSALDSGKYPMHIEKLNMAVLLDYVLQGNQNSAKKKGQNLIVKSEKNCFVMADGSSIRRVLDNLISNAIKYSPYSKDITISLFKNKDHVRLEVCDKGPGLSDEDKQKIFGKFQRLHAQPTGGESSSGLGLSIVKQIVDLHNGRVWAESDGPGTGTTFIVELPA